MSCWLAHSAGDNPPVPPQPYGMHILNVLSRAEKNVGHLLKYYRGEATYFREAVRAAALYHDLGKLDDANQAVLRQEQRGEHLPVNHVDAGTTLLMNPTVNPPTILVYSHHRGIPSIPQEKSRGIFCFRDTEIAELTNAHLPDYLIRHKESGLSDLKFENRRNDWTPLTLRMALSCLVDADHGDTASHYQKEFPISSIAPEWERRLDALDRYVKTLSSVSSRVDARTRLRQQIYKSCRVADTTPAMYACDSPVGTGKTTAVMAHLLNAAKAKELRHIIIVLPYTNIIKQSVGVYRKALTLDSENPTDVVAEHHHQADFESLNVRHLATSWKSRIIVTTAVQFFESIASNHPSRLRKMHELPGSGIFIDEAHAAIPTFLWPQTWNWLIELTERWGCHLVMGSGSLSRFWELPDLIDKPKTIPDLVPEKLRQSAVKQDKRRIVPIQNPGTVNEAQLIELILDKPGPRLVVMNTVQSAGLLADKLAKLHASQDDYKIDIEKSKVLHLSTALTPAEREVLVDVVRKRLDGKNNYDNRDFTLVATSCVEAGIDFSFRSAFRERAGVASLIQVGGRVRRNLENFEATLIDFKIEASNYNRHPAFTVSSQVLEKLFEEGRVRTDSPADLVTESLRRELMSDSSRKHEILKKAERDMDFDLVAQLYKVIASNTFLVVVNSQLIKKLEIGDDRIHPQELNRHSVQIWADKLEKLCVYRLEKYAGLFALKEDEYDNYFLGYMRGILRQLKQNELGNTVF